MAAVRPELHKECGYSFALKAEVVSCPRFEGMSVVGGQTRSIKANRDVSSLIGFQWPSRLLFGVMSLGSDLWFTHPELSNVATSNKAQPTPTFRGKNDITTCLPLVFLS
jgi:hypothetical protein